MSSDIDVQLDEIVNLYQRAGHDMNCGFIPTESQWRALLESSWSGKVQLITFYNVQKTAKPADELTQEVLIKRGEETGYNEKMGFLLKKWQVKDGLFGIPITSWIGDDEQWDFFYTSEFPSKEALISFYLEPDYIEAQKLRPLAIESQITIIIR